MPRFVGIKNNYISIVSDKSFSFGDLKVLEIPKELEHLSASELITDCKITNNEISLKKHKKPAKELKIALVGNWRMRCGISTYSQNLWPEVTKHVKEFKLFIEENDLLTGDIFQVGDKKISKDQVSMCWKRGDSTQKLVDELIAYNPDIIWIQHEFGLWPNAAHWLSMMSQLSSYRIITTMHSVFYHQDKTIVEAAMPEIVVHLDGANKLLKNIKCVPGNVYTIPHGCDPCLDKNKLWNMYKTNYTFMQFGFLFRYKGWQIALETVSLLKNKYPDIFFTGLCSESPSNKFEHQVYYNELITLIEKLNIKENVALIRGYQSDQTLNSYLRTNKVALFPYISSPEHEVFGASGAARLAMSKAIPVITSSVNHFSDLNTIKADTPEQIAKELDRLFSSPEAIQNQIDNQLVYLQNNSWEQIGLKYIKLFES